MTLHTGLFTISDEKMKIFYKEEQWRSEEESKRWKTFFLVFYLINNDKKVLVGEVRLSFLVYGL